MQQRDEAWFQARAGKLTGSRFADLMATTKSGPSASRGNLLALLAVERLTGTCVETYSNAAMLRGIALEPEAIAAYEAHIGDLVDTVAWWPHPSLPNVGMSPDGVVGDYGLVEAKCPQSMQKHLEALRSGAHAQEYRWQIQGQLFCSGRAWCDAVSYDPRFPEGLQLAITRVLRDEKAIADLKFECIKADAEVDAMVLELQQMRAKS